jgi:ATP-dependent Clp protease ATP-binding subunit ClpC
MISSMRPAFSQPLTAALHNADEEARRLRQEFVGIEHLLLGILTEDSGQAARILESAVDIQDLRRQLIKSLPYGSDEPLVTGRLPLSPKAQAIINAAMSAASASDEPAVSTRAVLLAAIEEPRSAVAKILSDCGADLEALTQQLRQPQENDE